MARLRKLGVIRVDVLGAAALLGVSGIAACGDGFGNTDCAASRTCAPAGGAGSDGPNEAGGSGDPGTSPGGQTSNGGDGRGGGDENMAGQAGAAIACVDADCDDGDPSNGDETCGNDGDCVEGNPPPTVIAVSPEDEEDEVAPQTEIRITFSEPLDAATVTAQTIKVLDGDREVSGEITYADGEVTFKPNEPLALVGDYVVSAGTAIRDEAGAELLEEFSSTFTIRDGEWKTITAVDGPLVRISHVLPMTNTGEAWLAWGGKGITRCPASIQPFRAGKEAAGLKSFGFLQDQECHDLVAAGNADGVLALAWTEHDNQGGSYTQQRRAGSWAATNERIAQEGQAPRPDLSPLDLLVAPNGTVTFFAHSHEGSKAWRADANGDWQSPGDPLSEHWATEAHASSAIDGDGNGLAVWRAKDEKGDGRERILASRYTAGARWAEAVDLPGSVTAGSATSVQRGTPALAFDGSGNALALWVDGNSTQLMASFFSSEGDWLEAETVSDDLSVSLLWSPPALVFDGTDWVAAWTAVNAQDRWLTYTARYKATTGWSDPEPQQGIDDELAAKRMPRLVADRRGNLMLVWAIGTEPDLKQVYQRYTHGSWGAITELPSGDIHFQSFEADYPVNLPISITDNGLIALAWGQRGEDGLLTEARLASFY